MYQNSWSYALYTVPEIWHVMDLIVIFYFGLFFALSPPLTARKIKISKKWKKLFGDVIILQKCTKNLIIWYTVPEKWHVTDLIIFHFGLFFALLPPQLTWKMKLSKKWKKHLEISSFYTSIYTKNHDHVVYCSWEIWCVTNVIVIFIWGYFVPFYPRTAQKIKIS